MWANTISRLLIAAALSIFTLASVAQDTLPYKEGEVLVVTAVRTQPGKFNDYFRYLSGPYSTIMDRAKQDGLLTEYTFYGSLPRSPNDPDIYIVETYPNMAAFDAITEKMNTFANEVFGSLKQSEEADANREEFRRILGTEMIRRLMPVKGEATAAEE